MERVYTLKGHHREFGMVISSSAGIMRVEPHSAAAQAGITHGYKILQVAGESVASKSDILQVLSGTLVRRAENVEFVLLWIPSAFYRCLCATGTTGNLDFDVDKQKQPVWQGGHIYQEGDIFEVLEHGFGTHVRRVRSPHGWVSLVTRHGTPLLEPVMRAVGQAALPFGSQLLAAGMFIAQDMGVLFETLETVTKTSVATISETMDTVDEKYQVTSQLKAQGAAIGDRLATNVKAHGELAKSHVYSVFVKGPKTLASQADERLGISARINDAQDSLSGKYPKMTKLSKLAKKDIGSAGQRLSSTTGSAMKVSAEWGSSLKEQLKVTDSKFKITDTVQEKTGEALKVGAAASGAAADAAIKRARRDIEAMLKRGPLSPSPKKPVKMPEDSQEFVRIYF